MTLKKYLNLNDFFGFLKGMYSNRQIIFQLTKKEIKKQYTGSFLGITWSFIQPLFYIGAIAIVFSIGLRGARSVGESPFLLYLVSGVIVWFFFAECLNSGTNSIMQNSYLVQKIVFRTSILPVIKILSALFIHSIFLISVIILFIVHQRFPDIYYLQILYYLFATFILVLGISWITSSVVLFFRDLNQIILIIVRIGFWFTPIFWNIDKIPRKYQWIIKINPVVYLVQGYRDFLIDKIWFWERPKYTIYYWIVTLLIFAFGSIVFRRLKPHFADVL